MWKVKHNTGIVNAIKFYIFGSVVWQVVFCINSCAAETVNATRRVIELIAQNMLLVVGVGDGEGFAFREVEAAVIAAYRFFISFW